MKAAILVFAAMFIVFMVPLAEQATTLQHDGLLSHADGVTLTLRGPAIATQGSPSVLGRYSARNNPTIGKLKDSRSGHDTKNCISDHTHNGVRDRQVVWEHGYPGHPAAWFIADEVRDRNGTRAGSSCHILRDPKELHQAQSITGGTRSYH